VSKETNRRFWNDTWAAWNHGVVRGVRFRGPGELRPAVDASGAADALLNELGPLDGEFLLQNGMPNLLLTSQRIWSRGSVLPLAEIESISIRKPMLGRPRLVLETLHRGVLQLVAFHGIDVALLERAVKSCKQGWPGVPSWASYQRDKQDAAAAALAAEGTESVLVVPATFCASPTEMRTLRDSAGPPPDGVEIAWLPGLGAELCAAGEP
jgi:hypothetical protein